MDKVYLRSLFLSKKEFLKKLYNGDKSVLNYGSDKALDTVIRILHLLSNGDIPMRKEDETIIKTSKKFNALNKFGSKIYFRELLNKSTRESKLKSLKQFLKLYPILLYSFFNEI